MNELMTKVFLKQPRLHRVYKLFCGLTPGQLCPMALLQDSPQVYYALTRDKLDLYVGGLTQRQLRSMLWTDYKTALMFVGSSLQDSFELCWWCCSDIASIKYSFKVCWWRSSKLTRKYVLSSIPGSSELNYMPQ